MPDIVATPWVVNTWANSVTNRELEANIVMLAHDTFAEVPMMLEGARYTALAGDVIEAARATLEARPKEGPWASTPSRRRVSVSTPPTS